MSVGRTRVTKDKEETGGGDAQGAACCSRDAGEQIESLVLRGYVCCVFLLCK